MKSQLVKLLGFQATLIHGDTLVLDRWLWLRRQLKPARHASQRSLDVGCGTGAFHDWHGPHGLPLLGTQLG